MPARRMVSLSAWWWPGECRRSRWQKEACLFCLCHHREREREREQSGAGVRRTRQWGPFFKYPASNSGPHRRRHPSAKNFSHQQSIASHRVGPSSCPRPRPGPSPRYSPPPSRQASQAPVHTRGYVTYPMPRARSTATPCVMAHAWSETPIHHQHSQESQARTCRIPPHSLSAASPPPEPGLVFPAATADAGAGGRKRERGGSKPATSRFPPVRRAPALLSLLPHSLSIPVSWCVVPTQLCSSACPPPRHASVPGICLCGLGSIIVVLAPV